MKEKVRRWVLVLVLLKLGKTLYFLNSTMQTNKNTNMRLAQNVKERKKA